jgi:hypothetical protein
MSSPTHASPRRIPGAPLGPLVGSSRRRVRRVAAVVAVVAALAFALTGITGCGGPDELKGTLRAADTKAKHGGPMSGGWIAVLTTDQLADFLRQSGISQPSAQGSAFVEGRVRHEAIGETGGTLVPVDEDGKFTTTVTGPRQLCVLRELPQVDVLRGCAAVDLSADGELAITVGDDGVVAKLHD